MVKKAGVDMEIHLTLDRREALKDADFVTTQLRVGLLDARIKDERIPLSHGVIGQETNGAGGLFKALRTVPVVLDIIKDIRKWSNIPIIVVSAREHENDKITALDAGADDYITKPFSLAILRARVHAVMRRNTERVKKIGSLTLDFDQMRFTKEGEELELSKTEQKLLRLLVEHPNTTLTRDFLIDRVWSDGAEFVNENALSVTIKRLRTKIEDDPKNPRYIKTVFGIGYQWGM